MRDYNNALNKIDKQHKRDQITLTIATWLGACGFIYALAITQTFITL